VKPLEMNIHTSWSEIVSSFKNYWYVPEVELNDIKSAPNIMFRAGNKATLRGVGSYPQLLSHNYDQFGSKLFDFSLLPDVTDGLIPKFHTKYKEWVEKDKKRLDVTVKLSPYELRSLNFRDKYYVGGRLFYIEKLEYVLSHAGVSLVEADLIEC
jgi:hypothetical protein